MHRVTSLDPTLECLRVSNRAPLGETGPATCCHSQAALSRTYTARTLPFTVSSFPTAPWCSSASGARDPRAISASKVDGKGTLRALMEIRLRHHPHGFGALGPVSGHPGQSHPFQDCFQHPPRPLLALIHPSHPAAPCSHFFAPRRPGFPSALISPPQDHPPAAPDSPLLPFAPRLPLTRPSLCPTSHRRQPAAHSPLRPRVGYNTCGRLPGLLAVDAGCPPGPGECCAGATHRAPSFAAAAAPALRGPPRPPLPPWLPRPSAPPAILPAPASASAACMAAALRLRLRLRAAGLPIRSLRGRLRDDGSFLKLRPLALTPPRAPAQTGPAEAEGVRGGFPRSRPAAGGGGSPRRLWPQRN